MLVQPQCHLHNKDGCRIHFLPLYNNESKTSCRSGDVLMVRGGNSAALLTSDDQRRMELQSHLFGCDSCG